MLFPLLSKILLHQLAIKAFVAGWNSRGYPFLHKLPIISLLLLDQGEYLGSLFVRQGPKEKNEPLNWPKVTRSLITQVVLPAYQQQAAESHVTTAWAALHKSTSCHGHPQVWGSILTLVQTGCNCNSTEVNGATLACKGGKRRAVQPLTNVLGDMFPGLPWTTLHDPRKAQRLSALESKTAGLKIPIQERHVLHIKKFPRSPTSCLSHPKSISA